MAEVLFIDFGSTYTKVAAVDLGEPRVLGWTQAPSTATVDIMAGLEKALAYLKAACGVDGWAIKERLACSSAAGGLRMIALGLVPELTSEAARRAALGAGAKLIKTFSYKLDRKEVQEIESLRPDILLLAGGTDGGNDSVILHNARLLAESGLTAPVVLAGNKSAASEGESFFKVQGKAVRIAENVMPELGRLNVESAREAIREIFMERIVVAKGFQKARDFVGQILMPTPMAVLKGAECLARGTESEGGLGELVVLDVGGATTDIHSISDGTRCAPGVIRKGLPEPYAKRTVEGDLGMRINAETIWEWSKRMKRDLSPGPPGETEEYIRRLTRRTDTIPQGQMEIELDKAMGAIAAELSMDRHAGTLVPYYLPGGDRVFTQTGKDLTGVGILIGTGGIFKYGLGAKEVLAAATFKKEVPFSLRPKDPRFFIDEQYILFACGLLSTIAPRAAVRLLRRHLKEV